MLKRNDGYTLVELIVVMAVGILIFSAAATLLVLGIRIYGNSSRILMQQKELQLVTEVMANAVAEEAADWTEDGSGLVNQDGETVLCLVGSEIEVRGTSVLDKVSDLKITSSGQLVTITITMDSGHTYETSVYCRLMEISEETEGEPALTEGDAALVTAYAERNYQEVLAFAVEHQDNPEGVSEFLALLASQYGSRGRILDDAGQPTGEYFSQWYIGSYEDNPGWNADTPWCACYLSWAMARCGGLAEVPRYANVDTFWVDQVTSGNWSKAGPVPGDIIFFDWIDDGDYDPQHVGAVIAVSDGFVYTIEGNSGGRVTVCRYDAEDPGILGYGKLQWK